MTEIEFYREALLQIAGNSTIAIDWQNEKIGASQWAQRVGQMADALLDVAYENNCFYDDKPP